MLVLVQLPLRGRIDADAGGAERAQQVGLRVDPELRGVERSADPDRERLHTLGLAPDAGSRAERGFEHALVHDPAPREAGLVQFGRDERARGFGREQ
ncbi:hypothetical protein GCM10025870_02830 [Agromyces marinus]|uniref:Uncharacterized protein n=1 Tax=Agromyces marinus TaxID=1389020 RepID=A0ABM8GXP6_9MICO|nr:hypothetical protein [Agromyces marinus]BDZ53210.1 hypothetical protein GCM10025870_02830 [Agromyces marinus]